MGGMNGPGMPPPWLINMHRFGPPPSSRPSRCRVLTPHCHQVPAMDTMWGDGARHQLIGRGARCTEMCLAFLKHSLHTDNTKRNFGEHLSRTKRIWRMEW